MNTSRRTQYQYRILTDNDLGNLRAAGANVDKWLTRHWDKLTQLWYNHVASGSARFGYLLPKGMRLPRVYIPRTKTQPTKPFPQSKTIPSALTSTEHNATNALRIMLGK